MRDGKIDFSTCPFVSRLPFNWKTPFGYLIAFSLEIASAYTMLFIALTALCLVVGSCWIFIGIVDDITNDLDRLNCNDETDHSEQCMKIRFFSTVQLYSDAKQLSSGVIKLQTMAIFSEKAFANPL